MATTARWKPSQLNAAPSRTSRPSPAAPRERRRRTTSVGFAADESTDVATTVIVRSRNARLSPASRLRRVASAAWPSAGCVCHATWEMIPGGGTVTGPRRGTQLLTSTAERMTSVIRSGMTEQVRDFVRVSGEQAAACVARQFWGTSAPRRYAGRPSTRHVGGGTSEIVAKSISITANEPQCSLGHPCPTGSLATDRRANADRPLAIAAYRLVVDPSGFDMLGVTAGRFMPRGAPLGPAGVREGGYGFSGST